MTRLVENDGQLLLKCGLLPPVGRFHWHAMIEVSTECGTEQVMVTVLDTDYRPGRPIRQAVAAVLRRWADELEGAP